MRFAEWISAVVLGALAAALAAISHAALVPLGVIVAVLGSFAVVRLVGLRTRSRAAILFAALAWVAVTLRASVAGFGGEILIWGSTASMIYLVLGSLAVIVAAVLPLERR